MMQVLANGIDLIPTIFEWMVAIALLIFAPLAIFRRSRHIAAVGFMIETPIFSLLLWGSSAVTVYAYWGLAPVILSTLGFGVGTVITAAILILISGTWTGLIGLTIMILATVGSAISAIALGQMDNSLPHSK
jgi:hypothetical protein